MNRREPPQQINLQLPSCLMFRHLFLLLSGISHDVLSLLFSIILEVLDDAIKLEKEIVCMEWEGKIKLFADEITDCRI